MHALNVTQRYVDAWNRRDAVALVASFTADGSYSDPATGGPIAGAALAAYAGSLWSSFPDLCFEVVSSGAIGDNLVALQWRMRGTNLGSWQSLPPTGRTVDLPGADFIVIAEDKIRSVQGYFDTRSLVEQLGLAAIVQPRAIGPYTFGTAASVRSGKNTRPGAFSLTSLHPRSADEVKHVVDTTRAIAAEMADMPGFISWTGINLGTIMMTVTAWERPDHIQQLMRNDRHRAAMHSVHQPGISAGMMTSTWLPERVSVLVRCPDCDRLPYGDRVDGRCECGARLPEPLPYW